MNHIFSLLSLLSTACICLSLCLSVSLSLCASLSLCLYVQKLVPTSSILINSYDDDRHGVQPGLRPSPPRGPGKGGQELEEKVLELLDKGMEMQRRKEGRGR